MKYFIGGAILGAVLMSTYVGMVYYILNEEEFAIPTEKLEEIDMWHNFLLKHIN